MIDDCLVIGGFSVGDPAVLALVPGWWVFWAAGVAVAQSLVLLGLGRGGAAAS